MARQNFGGFGGVGDSDVRLQYIDDDPASYENIFNSAKTDVTNADQQRLIASLKALSEGTEIESIVDVEAVIRYLAVHNFMCNDDSYTGMMVHNYYLYEEDGQMSLLPWDYNLALGGFSMGGFGGSSGATSTVNSPIDSPVSMGDVDSRPMVAWIFQNEAYTELYHQIYDEFISNIFESGWFAEEIERVSAMIAPYVQNDVTGFFSYEEFQSGVDALREFCTLRAESIRGQLEGTIPSTTAGQRTESGSLIDASHVELSDMGEFGMGGGGNGFPGMPGSGSREERSSGRQSFGGAAVPERTGSQELPAAEQQTETRPGQNAKPEDNSEKTQRDGMRMPEKVDFPEMGLSSQNTSSGTDLLVLLAVSAAVLACAVVFALLYRSGR